MGGHSKGDVRCPAWALTVLVSMASCDGSDRKTPCDGMCGYKDSACRICNDGPDLCFGGGDPCQERTGLEICTCFVPSVDKSRECVLRDGQILLFSDFPCYPEWRQHASLAPAVAQVVNQCEWAP